MEYDRLILRIRAQPFYQEADAYQISVRHSTMSYLGGAWLRRPADQSPQENRLTPAWAQTVRERYRRYIERYWQAAENDEESFMSSSARISQAQVMELGQEMFEALPWSVQEILQAGLRHARQHGHGLQVSLEFDGRDGPIRQVADLPWELLYTPTTDTFLILSGPVSLVRSLPEAMPSLSPSLTGLWRVLAVVANPRDLLVSLDRELEELQQISESVRGKLILETLSGPDTMGQMRRRLAMGNLDGVILVAHGELGNRIGHRFLLLEDEQGCSQRVDDRFLRPLFNDAPSLKFVTLGVCHSAESCPSPPTVSGQDNDAPQPEAPLAELLVRDGIPAVIAMQDRMSIRANRCLLRALIDGLAGGSSLEEALRRSRKTVYQSLFDPIHWSVPVLYLPTELSPTLPWYARLADGLAEWFWRPEAIGSITGTLAVALIWTLINLVIGLGMTRPWPPLQLSPLQGWLLLAWLLLSPGLIAALHRPRHPQVRRLSRTAQLVYKLQGANVGMLIGVFSALLVFSLVYYSSLWSILPEQARQFSLALGLAWGAFMSYSQVRAIPRVMTVNAHIQPPQLSGADILMALFWPLVLLMLLLGGRGLNDLWAIPALGSAVVAAILLAMILALRRGDAG